MSVAGPLWRRWLLPVCVVLGGGNLLALAVWTLPRSYRERNAAARAEVARADEKRERETVNVLRERAAAIRANIADLGLFYGRHVGSEKTGLVAAVESVEAMVRSSGRRPGSRGFSRAPVKGAPLERVRIALPLAGPYEELVGFLREVERSDHFLTVDRVSMQGEAGSAKLQVEMSAYLELAPEERATRSGRVR